MMDWKLYALAAGLIAIVSGGASFRVGQSLKQAEWDRSVNTALREAQERTRQAEASRDSAEAEIASLASEIADLKAREPEVITRIKKEIQYVRESNPDSVLNQPNDDSVLDACIRALEPALCADNRRQPEGPAAGEEG